jgi:RNA polymerase sigma factor (sigma-70 family)
MSEAVAAPFSRLFSDERLTRRAVGGDEHAFAAIFRRYHQSLYRFCLAIVGNPDDASEALQNTMIKVLRALPGEERRIELKPWLYRIAHNESIDLLRRRKETRELDVEQIAPGHGLAEDAATRERLRRLVADLKELPERQREVLVMRELAGLGFEEIGSALDTSGAVARQTLYEARQSLQQMETGREMSCATVTRALSDGDGRVTRRRDVRAHLRNCAQCQAFRDEIKRRQHDLAALSPLPAVAAAGMLHGLIGGSQGAAGGGGLATAAAGGAAKTVGASAAVKGVATAAVVAAIGVTAADRSGVIHLGLPGERTTKSSAPVPGSPDAAPASNGTDSGARGRRDRSAGGKVAAGGAAAVKGAGSVRANADSAMGAGAPMGTSAAHAQGHQQSHEVVSADPQEPQLEHPSAGDHGKQDSEAAADGEQTASSHKPPRSGDDGETETSDGEGEGVADDAGEAVHGAGGAAHPPKPVQPEAPAPPTSAPSAEVPANPPAELPPQAHPPHPEHPDTPGGGLADDQGEDG